MMNAHFQNLPLKWKITLSSAFTGTILSFGFSLLQPDGYFYFTNRDLGGVSLHIWIIALFFGAVMAWAEVWKKNLKSALLQFLATTAAFLVLKAYSALLPPPISTLLGILSFMPFTFFMFYMKTALAQGTWHLSRRVTLQVLLSALVFNVAFYHFPVLLLGHEYFASFFTGFTSFLHAPLFYLIAYRLAAGKEWQDLFFIKAVSKKRFVILFSCCWLLLLVSLVRLSSVIPNMGHTFDLGMEAHDQIIMLTNDVLTCLYYAFTVLALCSLCSRLLASWHAVIMRPLGWPYLLSFVPVLNLFTITYLLRLKPDSWSSTTRWQEHLEAERNKLATGVVILSMLGSFASIVFDTITNNYVPASSLYNSLFISALTAFSVFALYRGGSFWAVMLVYIAIYGLILSIEAYSNAQMVTTFLIVRLLGMFIYYEALKPSANRHLQEQLAMAQNA